MTRYYYPRFDEPTSFALDNNLTFKFSHGCVEHTLLAELDYRRSRDDHRSAFAFGAPSINLYNPVYRAPLQMPDYS